MRCSGSQRGARPVPQALVFMEGDAGYQCHQDGCYTLGYSLPPSPMRSTGHLMRAFSPGLLEQWKPGISEFLNLASLRLHGMWCLPPAWTAMDPKEEWS